MYNDLFRLSSYAMALFVTLAISARISSSATPSALLSSYFLCALASAIMCLLSAYTRTSD